MTDHTPASDSSETFWKRFQRNPLFAIAIGAVIILLALLFNLIFTLPNPTTGIVYPIDGQTISPHEVSIYSTLALDEIALTEALQLNGKKAVLESIIPIFSNLSIPTPPQTANADNSTAPTSFAQKYVIRLALADGDVLSIDSALYNSSLEGSNFRALANDVSWPVSSTDAFIHQVNETQNSEITAPEFEAYVAGGKEGEEKELLVFSLGIRDATDEYFSCAYNLDDQRLDWSQFERHAVKSQEEGGRITFWPKGEWNNKDSCFFVALQEDADSVRWFYQHEAKVPAAAMSLKELFNPAQDFQSSIAIDFTTPLFDTKKLRSEEEEIQYRLEYKKELASWIDVSPSVEINPESIVLYDKRAEIHLPLTQKTRYTVKFTGGKDVYGQEIPAQSLVVETGELKYLGLRLKETQSVFLNAPTIDLVHYAVTDPTVRLCSIGLEEYGKIEQVTSRRSRYDFAEKFLLEGIDQLPTKKCEETKVALLPEVHKTSVDMATLLGSPSKPGLYYMTFAFQSERKVKPESPAANPLFFAIVDSHITMKLSKNGKSFFWVNDLQSGKGVPNLSLQGYQNIFTAFEGRWDDATRKHTETLFSPLEKAIYSEPISLGKTDQDGFLEANLKSQDYMNAFDSWYADPQHRSVLVVAEGSDHLSYVSSRWNSGIADWNFGFQPESYDIAGKYSAHLLTDRKLYMPGEVVHFKAIIRENANKLEIPAGKKFTLTLRDPGSTNLFEKTISVSEFGSYLEDWNIPEEASLGIYRFDLRSSEEEEVQYIRTIEFSVEEFEKPTFKVEVSVDSPELQDGKFFDPTITEAQTGWGYSYKNYVKDMTLKADITASYYAGGLVQSAPLTYRVFRQYYYENSYWDNCYYGCYYEPFKEYVSEGTSALDAAGHASITIPITHQTQWSDYRYLVEITVTDPSSQAVTGAGSVLVKIPESLRQTNPEIKVELEADKKFVPVGESITVSVKPERKWDKANNDQYKAVLTHRQYTTKHSKQTGGEIVPQVDYEDTVIEEVSVNTSKFELTKEGTLKKGFTLKEDGEYQLRLMSSSASSDPETFIFSSDSAVAFGLPLYAYDPKGITNTPVVADNKIAVVTEKVSYHLGEKARFLVRLPFAEGRALITFEKKNVTFHEVLDLKGNTLIKEYTVDDTFLPNAYFSVIAFKPGANPQPEYKVGYAEVVVDKTDKKLFLETKPNAEVYAPRDPVTVDLTAKDQKGKPVQAELSVAVIDEALIAIMGNIDLDILPKFFQKIVFQTHTALTNVAMWKDLYFARKGVVGGSGGKDGGDSIFTRTDFKNTAFYVGAVVTDANGKAKLTFTLPDNIGDFRIITVGHSKSNFFGSGEKTISVRQEITVEETFPMIARIGDDMRVGATVFNNSKENKTVAVSLDAQGLTTPDNNRQSVTIKPNERSFVTWRVRVQNDAKTVTYTITAADEKTKKGDRIQKSVPVATVPLIADRLHYQDDFQTSVEKVMSLIPDIDPNQTKVELSFSTSILAGVEKIITSLLQYPYGCIEQTISSTLPNAVVKKFQDLLDIGIDQKSLQTNLQAGIKRFQSMQTADGGFAYWEGSTTSEPHITPYAVLAITQMRDLGVEIPPDMLERGKAFIENKVKSMTGNIPDERLSQLVHELHALSRLDSAEFGTARTLIKNRLNQLTMHEKIVYGLGLAKKDFANYSTEILSLIDIIDLAKAGDSDRNWYWDATADKALFTQLLMIAKPDDKRILPFIKDLYALDLGSYYHSTQAKIQSFIAFTQYIEKFSAGKPDLTVDYQLGSDRGKLRFNGNTVFRKISKTLQEVQVGLSELKLAAKSTGSTPVYVDLVVYQIPKDPTTIKAQQDKGVTVDRQYFRMGEVKETDKDWWVRKERDLAPVAGGKFKLGETYLVRITTDFTDQQHQVALESYLPAGFKLLNPRFKTEQSQVGEQQWNWPFTHQELRADRFFGSAEHMDDRSNTLTYYVRATIAGEFLEPPVSVYPMYRPEIEGHTEFRRITIEE